ncbi:nitroreductase family deazaflavin-dependent oxidoreductase [bacterium]|nr:nitroreductase family deazaflavin-dependent oxidoreductase [bacterium]
MPPDPVDLARLAAIRTIDISTSGRRSGSPSRIEIWWFHVEGRFIITGTPGRRDWYANLHADPSVVIHVPFGDFAGRAVVIDDPVFRRRVFTDPETDWYTTQEELDVLVATSPMVEIVFD